MQKEKIYLDGDYQFIDKLEPDDSLHCGACVGTGKAMNYAQTQQIPCGFCEGTGLAN